MKKKVTAEEQRASEAEPQCDYVGRCNSTRCPKHGARSNEARPPISQEDYDRLFEHARELAQENTKLRGEPRTNDAATKGETNAEDRTGPDSGSDAPVANCGGRGSAGSGRPHRAGALEQGGGSDAPVCGKPTFGGPCTRPPHVTGYASCEHQRTNEASPDLSPWEEILKVTTDASDFRFCDTVCKDEPTNACPRCAHEHRMRALLVIANTKLLALQRTEPASSGETWAKGFCAGEDQAVEMLGESGHYAAAKWLRSRLSRERAKEAKDARASVVEASPAKEVPKRGEHRGGSLGPCSRCGRSREDRSGLCPPAYWMTEKELRRWESALSAITRSRMEETLGRAPEAS